MKAVDDDYKPRTMAILCQEALEFLRKQGGKPVGCGYVGEQLFFHASHRGSAPFARIAGKVLKRLKDAGLASGGMSRGYDWPGWHVTDAGRNHDYQC